MGKIRVWRAAEPVQVKAWHQIEPEVQADLVNWGRWAALRIGLSHARRHAAAVRVDRAWDVERTVCNPMFSPRFRELLTMHYVRGHDSISIARALSMHHQEFERELWRSARYFCDRFGRETPERLLTAEHGAR